MFSEILNEQLKLNNYKYYPPATDRVAWTSFPKDYVNRAIAAAKTNLGFTFSAIPATVFMKFLRTGNRVDFEDINFGKRYALNSLIIAECIEYKGRFLDDIINGIFSICEESAWQLPPHNSYPGMRGNQLLPDVTTPVLDLFACETGALLATAYYLLGEAFDKVHPFINKRILHEISTRILTPYLNEHFWWMGNGKDKMSNWTIWCTQNVLITAFLSEQSEDLRKAVLNKACASIDDFLKDYGVDGCCDEGAQYYRHAGLCLFNAAEIINAVTNGAFTAIYATEKICNMALYIHNVHVNDIYYVNFADCSPVAGRAGAREFLFGKRIGSPTMMDFAATDFKAEGELLLPKEINLFYHVQNAFTVAEMLEYKPLPSAEKSDIFYESVGVLISHDDSLFLAVKAGCNADNHNHNDTGSFTIYKNGLPFLIDVGVGTYTAKTFSPQRYELWPMQSAYHNLPTINGIMQKDGKEFCATDVEYEFSDDSAHISMDIASAYPQDAGINSYKRSVDFKKNDSITITDDFKFEANTGEVVLSLMTYEKPVVSGNNISIGTLGNIAVSSPGTSNQPLSITTEEIVIDDARLSIAWKHNIYRILLRADIANGKVITRIR
ncbi:MAG: heparinase II/III family protein [Lachnospiraceae bacterium]|nr:heparinase II/III family protein [Lachnospiraceae bacterium]